MRKKILALAVATVLVTMAAAAARDPYMEDKFAIRVNLERELYHGQYWKYSIGTVDIGNGCTLPSKPNITYHTRSRIKDYGCYSMSITLHEWNNADISTWYRCDFCGKEAAFMYLSSDLEGIWIIDVELYENGRLIDSRHIVWNFQAPDRLRFS